MNLKILGIIFLMMVAPSFATEKNFLEKVLEKRVAASVKISGQEISLTVKEKGRFGFKQGKEISSVLQSSETKKFSLEDGEITIYARHYLIEINPVDGEKNTFTINERIDLRSVGKKLKSHLVKFKVSDGKVVKIWEKTEDEKEVRDRLKGKSK